MNQHDTIIQSILDKHPETLAIYLFGSYGTENEWPDSDIDIGVLLPVETAKQINSWDWMILSVDIATAMQKEKADLINLRQADTVLCKEVISAERRIYCANEFAADEFEMLTISFYQKLNEERAEILKHVRKTGRAYAV